MKIRSDLTGKVFGNLTVLQHAGKTNTGKSQWLCLCKCGNKKILPHRALIHDGITGCGCKQPLRHGKVNSPTYVSWVCLKSRCKRSPRHAGRGIKVCDKWLNSFAAFLEDMGERPEGMVIDRINNDGDYEPNNCRWTTHKINNNNRSNSVFLTYKGETKLLQDWGTIMGINSRTLRDRIKTMSVEDALTKPVGRWV